MGRGKLGLQQAHRAYQRATPGLDLFDPVAGAHDATLDHTGVDPAQIELAAGLAVEPARRLGTEALRELGASGVRLDADLEQGGSDFEPRAGRQVCVPEVQ